jgi:hypothetical protein
MLNHVCELTTAAPYSVANLVEGVVLETLYCSQSLTSLPAASHLWFPCESFATTAPVGVVFDLLEGVVMEPWCKRMRV